MNPITQRTAKTKLGKVDGRMSKYLINYYMAGYNDAVAYINKMNDKPEKACPYCGTKNLRRNKSCVRCGIDF